MRIIKLIVSLLLTLIILNVFIAFYRYNGARIVNQTGSTDYKWSPYQLYTHMEEGFSFNIFDKYGFNNYNIDNTNIDILLMGSSNMEGSFVNNNENVGYLLNKSLPQYKTYNIGIGSHYFVDCLRNLNNAYKTYIPKKYILLETMTLKPSKKELEDFIKGKTQRLRCFKEDSVLVKLQKIFPFVKWYYIQLTQWLAKSYPPSPYTYILPKSNNQDMKFNIVDLYSLLDSSLELARREISDQVKIIIFYHSTFRFDKIGKVINNIQKDDYNSFKRMCEKNGYLFVDISEDMENLYKTRHILCRGFINTKVGVGHLNKYGHKIIAKHLIKEIRKLEGIVE